MPCLSAPAVPFPTLPSPLGLSGINLATPPLSATFCCTLNLPQLVLPIPPINIGMLGPAAIAIIAGYLLLQKQVAAFIALLTISCPLE
jgi:hypothetical protein